MELFEIKAITHYSPKTARITVYAPDVARSARPGHFAIVRFSDCGARIPFTIVSTDASGTIDLIIHRAAGLDDELMALKPGVVLPDLLGPLGRAEAVPDGTGSIVYVGDGAGFVPLLPLMEASRNAGRRVYALFSEDSAAVKCLVDEASRWAEVIDAGGRGDIVALGDILDSDKNVDAVYLSAPAAMMKDVAAFTADRAVPTRCVLNMTMIDGIGLCGICRVNVDGHQRLTCVDGPVFDAHKVDFDGLMKRQRLFK